MMVDSDRLAQLWIVWKLLVLGRSTDAMCKLFVLDRNTWYGCANKGL